MRRFCFVSITLLLLVFGMASCTAQEKTFTEPNSSMEPTILKGEGIAAEMTPFRPSRGDLIIFEHQGLMLLKRVIGVPGDKIEGRDLEIFVNGKRMEEQYVIHLGKRPLGLKSLETFGPVTIPAGKFFVAGDNRDFSLDSRDPSFGLISASDIKGRPIRVTHSSDPKRIGRAL